MEHFNEHGYALISHLGGTCLYGKPEHSPSKYPINLIQRLAHFISVVDKKSAKIESLSDLHNHFVVNATGYEMLKILNNGADWEDHMNDPRYRAIGYADDLMINLCNDHQYLNSNRHCICGQCILHRRYLRHIKSDTIVLIGSQCVQKFKIPEWTAQVNELNMLEMGKKSRCKKCTGAFTEIKMYDDKMCKKCAVRKCTKCTRVIGY